MKLAYLPKGLYELLPAIYAAAGMAGLYFAGHNFWVLISSTLLFGTAFAVWCLRAMYRGERRREELFEDIRRARQRRERADRVRFRRGGGEPPEDSETE